MAPGWTEAQQEAAYYCAETLRTLLEQPSAKLAMSLLTTRGKNAVAHATEAGLFGREPEGESDDGKLKQRHQP